MDSQNKEQLVRTIVEVICQKSQKSHESQKKQDNQNGQKKCREENMMNVPVGVSARHIHLSREHVEILFGKGYQLNKKQELMGGQFAATECVTVVGQSLRAIENVRVLGPERKQTQVEVSATDGIRLGVSAPLRESGHLGNSASIAVVGPKGAVYLNEGCIIAARHIHMPSENELGLQDGDIVSVKINNGRGLTLDNVKIRVDPTFTLEMHIDTDEANACFLKTGDIVKVFKGGK